MEVVIRCALISAWDKRGIVDFARELAELDIEILSTGGTAQALRTAGIAVTPLEQRTGFAELLGGRVKTLHPAIHAAILADRGNPEHLQQLAERGIKPIDLVCVNLYPFAAAVAASPDDDATAIEMIDIGGPALLRAAAKNFRWVVPLVSERDYTQVLEHLRMRGTVPFELRKALAARVFAYTCSYDATIAHYFAPPSHQSESFLCTQSPRLHLRYGENPHQQAAYYGDLQRSCTQLHGKELSYNNLLDIDAALRLVTEFSEPTVAIIKHTNPCGVGSASNLVEAWDKAYATDTVSPFGGIVTTNAPIDEDFAAHIHPLFTEIILAPAFTDRALELLTKKRDRRLLVYNPDAVMAVLGLLQYRSVLGGALVQTADTQLFEAEQLQIVTERHPTDTEFRALVYAWKVAKHAKSNAIVYAAPDRTLAIGAGQPSRVDSARIAAWKAQQFGIDLRGSAVASDAFFPFADGVVQCVEAGATAIIQPGGSIRDEEVIRVANEHNVAMIFTGMRHFLH